MSFRIRNSSHLKITGENQLKGQLSYKVRGSNWDAEVNCESRDLRFKLKLKFWLRCYDSTECRNQSLPSKSVWGYKNAQFTGFTVELEEVTKHARGPKIASLSFREHLGEFSLQICSSTAMGKAWALVQESWEDCFASVHFPHLFLSGTSPPYRHITCDSLVIHLRVSLK